VFLDAGQDVVIDIHIGDQIIDPVKGRIAESEVESHLGVITQDKALVFCSLQHRLVDHRLLDVGRGDAFGRQTAAANETLVDSDRVDLPLLPEKIRLYYH